MIVLNMVFQVARRQWHGQHETFGSFIIKDTVGKSSSRSNFKVYIRYNYMKNWSL